MTQVWSRLPARRVRLAITSGALLPATAMHESPAAPAPLAAHRAASAGHTIIEGGTGGSEPVPVTTLAAFRVTASGGDFECLAPAPPRPAGPGSGAFTTNVVHVTGTVTSLSVSRRSAKSWGTATVTGLGAGHDRPFHGENHRRRSGDDDPADRPRLAFHEIHTEGHLDVS